MLVTAEVTKFNNGAGQQNIWMFAASAATQEEVETAKTQYDNGSKPVPTERWPYRPMLASHYEEPAHSSEDDNNALEQVWYQNEGVAISKQGIGHRTPEAIYKHGEILQKLFQLWEDCQEQLRRAIREIIKQYWDIFAPEGLWQ